MIQRIFNGTRTPETPEKLSQSDHSCKMIQMPRHALHADAPLDIGALLSEIKHDSESILRLMEQHQGQRFTDR